MKLEETYIQQENKEIKSIFDKEVIIRPGDNLGNIFGDRQEEELERFNSKITKMFRSSLGADRPKSFNPHIEALEYINNLKFGPLVMPPKKITEKLTKKEQKGLKKWFKWFKKLIKNDDNTISKKSR